SIEQRHAHAGHRSTAREAGDPRKPARGTELRVNRKVGDLCDDPRPLTDRLADERGLDDDDALPAALGEPAAQIERAPPRNVAVRRNLDRPLPGFPTECRPE